MVSMRTLQLGVKSFGMLSKIRRACSWNRVSCGCGRSVGDTWGQQRQQQHYEGHEGRDI
jgi:hypothetical protein